MGHCLDNHDNHDNTFIRIQFNSIVCNKNVYYYEYRTTVGNLKLYYQRKTVTYADYIVGKWYVSTEVAYSDTPPTNSVQVITGPECEVSRG